MIRTRSSRAALPVPAPASAPAAILPLLVSLLVVPRVVLLLMVLLLLARALRLVLPSFSSFLASPSATLATSQRLATYLEQNHLQNRDAWVGATPAGHLFHGKRV